MRRAFCLRDAFQLCGVPLAEAMLASELGTLPDICFTLDNNNNNNNNNNNDSSDRDAQSSPTTEGDSREPVPSAETTRGQTTTTGGRKTGPHSSGGGYQGDRGRSPSQVPNVPAADGVDEGRGGPRKESPSPASDEPASSGATVGQSTGDGSSAEGLVTCSLLLMTLTVLFSSLAASV